MIRNSKFKEELTYEYNYLKQLKEKTQQLLKITLPGSLHIQRKNNQVFYRISMPGTSSNRNDRTVSQATKPISKSDPLLPEYIKVYCAKKMLPVISRCISSLTNNAERYDPTVIENLLDQFASDFGTMTPTAFWNNALWIRKWQNTPYRTNTMEPESKYTFLTERGETVRSKNECLAANLLNHWQIPYKYEFPVRLNDGREIYIDFKILGPDTLKESYIEIFGKMDDPDYLRKNLRRINDLSDVGIQEGKNLLIMFDCPDVPFETNTFRAMIKNMITQR